MEPLHPHSKSSRSDLLSDSQEAELMSLVELQDFLQAELAEQGLGFKRAFTPLTDGLGLESPQNSGPRNVRVPIIEEPEPKQKAKSTASITNERILEKSAEGSQEEEDDKRMVRVAHRPENSLASVIESPAFFQPASMVTEKPKMERYEEAHQSTFSENAQITPPPLPRPSMIRRLLAGMIDQVFVLMLWLTALVLTSNVLSGFETGFSAKLLADFSKPFFQRMAAFEFAAIWFVYLGLTLLAFKRTFGMWVWGICVSYGEDDNENHSMRRIMRVIWSFVFSAPIVTSLLLMIRRNGRNILDVLSGTNVYDAA